MKPTDKLVRQIPQIPAYAFHTGGKTVADDVVPGSSVGGGIQLHTGYLTSGIAGAQQQPQQPAQAQSVKTPEPERKRERRVVDTSAVQVNANRFADVDNLVSEKVQNYQGGKQRIGGGKGAKQQKQQMNKKGNKSRNEEQEKLRRLQMEVARKAPVTVNIPDEITASPKKLAAWLEMNPYLPPLCSSILIRCSVVGSQPGRNRSIVFLKRCTANWSVRANVRRTAATIRIAVFVSLLRKIMYRSAM